MLPSVVISVHAVVLECWPYFSVAGDQQGCDFNLVDLHRFNYVELDGIRNFRQQKSHWFRAAFKLNRRKAKQRVRLLYVQFRKDANGIRSGH